MSQPVFVIVKVTCKPGEMDRVKEVMKKGRAETTGKESDRQTLYEMLEQTGEENKFAIIERWNSEEALEKHKKEQHYKETIAGLEPLLAGPIDIALYSAVSPRHREGTSHRR